MNNTPPNNAQIPVPGPVTIVVPVYQERDSLPKLYEELLPVLNALPEKSEVLFVDDGSTDGSFDYLEELHGRDARIRALRFRRNMGKAVGLSAGFEHAKGEIIVTMDGDLQDDPADIQALLTAIADGADLACGWKYQGKGPANKSLPSRFFNFVTSRVTGIKLHDMNCPLKAYRREVIEEIDVYGDLHRFIPVLAHQRGFVLKEVKVQNRPRQFGTSKFGIERFTRGFFDLMTVFLLTRYAQRPLHFFGTLALLTGLIGTMSIAGLMAYTKLTLGSMDWRATPSRPLFFIGLLAIMLAFQFFSIGLIGELLTKFFHRSQRNAPIKHVIE